MNPAAMQQAPQVAIAGGGPVGLTLAALLGQYGVSVLVLEREPTPQGQPRAIAADDVMLRVLRPLPGMQALVSGMLGPIPVRIEDNLGRRVTEIEFGLTELGLPGLAFFHQPALEAALLAALETLPTVAVRRGVEVIGLTPRPANVDVALASGEPVRAQYVVGCDGASSTVRRLIGASYTGRTAPRRWLVVDADTDPPLTDHFTYRMDPARPSVCMPRPGGHRWEFMLHRHEEPAALIDPKSVRALIAPEAAGRQIQLVRAAAYPFHARIALPWRQGRVLLAGDAAHCMPPFAGHGLGAGIRDAASLAWRLAEAVHSGSAPSTLDEYEAERRPDVRAMTRTALIAGALLQTTSRSRAAAARLALHTVDALPISGPWFRAGGLRPRPRLAGSGRGPSGRPLPNPVVHAEGRACRLDQLLRPGWVLLVHPGDSSIPAVLRHRKFQPLSVGASALAAVQDRDGELLALLNRAGGQLIVRPDRYLA